jgi:SagB-type dehydrogenase family enzyme
MIPLDDAKTLSLLYHLNSEPWSNTEAYQESLNYEVEYKEMAGPGEAFTLPTPTDSTLLRLMRSRESCREFQMRSMPLEILSTVLGGAYGVARLKRLSGAGSAYFRTAPSAGGLFPLELYALVRDVEGVADGVHHYNVRRHALEPLKVGRWFEELDQALIMASVLQRANLLLFLSAVFTRSQKKYGPRGYRYATLEAGHVAQNICLLATEQGLGSLCVGGFYDSKLNRFLGLDGISEAVVYTLALGYMATVE